MSQSARILEYLRSHPGGLTQMEAIDAGLGTRLAARIADIKDDGMLGGAERIVTRMEPHNGGQHARYVLVDVNRSFLTTDEWYAFLESPHCRHGHRPGPPVVGCAWCVRFAAMDAVFRGGEVAVVEDTVEPTIWGDAA